MDYVAEQEMEIEALEAILMDEMEVYNGTTPSGWDSKAVYRVKLQPTEEEEQKLDRRIVLDFLFCYTETYPDEAPHIRLQSSAGLSDEDISQVQVLVENEIEENKGMAMMFNLIEIAREWLRDKVSAGGLSGLSAEEQKKALEAEEEKRIMEQRSHGTPVTVETFMKWKQQFEEEMRAKAAKENRGKPDERMQKLTGKEYFFKLYEGDIVEEGDQEELEEDDQEELEEDDQEEPEEEDLEEDQVESIDEKELNYDDDDDEGMVDAYFGNV